MILTVKEYHKTIAQQRWEYNKLNPKTMFFFYLSDHKGYPTKLRQRGYVTIKDNSYRFTLHKPKNTSKP